MFGSNNIISCLDIIYDRSRIEPISIQDRSDAIWFASLSTLSARDMAAHKSPLALTFQQKQELARRQSIETDKFNILHHGWQERAFIRAQMDKSTRNFETRMWETSEMTAEDALSRVSKAIWEKGPNWVYTPHEIELAQARDFAFRQDRRDWEVEMKKRGGHETEQETKKRRLQRHTRDSIAGSLWEHRFETEMHNVETKYMAEICDMAAADTQSTEDSAPSQGSAGRQTGSEVD